MAFTETHFTVNSKIVCHKQYSFFFFSLTVFVILQNHLKLSQERFDVKFLTSYLAMLHTQKD